MKTVKTAVVYDKWLSQLGGGEVVACTITQVLKKLGYEVTFISGKYVSHVDIERKLNIDMSSVEFKTAWNDELEIKKISRNKNLFINCTFVDYSRGYAKKNLYYTHFPSKAHNSILGKLLNLFLLPALAYGFVPQEPIKGKVQYKYNLVIYPLRQRVRFSYYYLSIGKKYNLDFKIYLPQFSKSTIELIKWNIEGAIVVKKSIRVEHRNNLVKIALQIIPLKQTIYLDVGKRESNRLNVDTEIYLIYKPRLYYFFNLGGYFNWLQQRLNNRFRAGVFQNALQRIHSYSAIIANSRFTKSWVRKYWGRDALLLYPPVNLIFKRKRVSFTNKKNWIASIARFIPVSHGKKQEVLVEAFKKFHDQGKTNWELHLMGGFESDPASAEFVNALKKASKGYPIFFHFNPSRNDVENILIKSKVFWHATGFGESKKRRPIKFEHFGIASVEAISAGCIPILFNGGGLVEIAALSGFPIRNFLFNTIEELVSNTVKSLKKDASLNWQDVFDRLEENFSLSAFEKNFSQIINSI